MEIHARLPFMTLIQAIIFGVVQGLTEFLPISSSAHLILLPWFFKWKDPGLAFNVALHWGTLAGVVFYFRKDIGGLISGWIGSFKGQKGPQASLPWMIIGATIPAAVCGYLLEDLAETTFRSPWVIIVTLSVVAVFLWFADRKNTNPQDLTVLSWAQAIGIGVSQAVALIPGVSRSGITIAVALFIGLNRQSAIRFSFLLSIPIIFGAGLLKVGYMVSNLTNPIFITGVVASGLSGYAAIAFLMSYVKTRTFTPFVIYRLALAALILSHLLIANS